MVVENNGERHICLIRNQSMMRASSIIAIILPLLLIHLPVSCQEINGSELKAADVIKSDINNDGDTDGWSYVMEGYVERQEIDMNFDGRVDSVFMYERDGRVKEELLDTNYDGKMDNWRFYDNGEIVKDSIDSDFDGKIDLWFYIDNGRIYKMEEDTDGDGEPDNATTY
jgi:hypothetical protein